MFKNYFKIAIRNLTKHIGYTSINVIGLSIGIICTILISMFVMNEISYDKYNVKHKRIYRLESNFILGGKDDNFALVSVPLAPTLTADYAEIESSCRFIDAGERYFKFDDKKFYEDNFYITDSTVFQIFSHELLSGDPAKCLVEPNSIVLAKTVAEKYFGEEHAIGKTLEDAEGTILKVTGVFADLPKNSHLKFDGLISATTLAERVGRDRFNDNSSGSFWNINNYSYVLLKENTNINSILDKSPEFYEKYMAEIGKQLNGNFTLRARALKDTHFAKGLQWDQPTGNISYVYIFTVVALFMILVACINYMNMATARSANRSKEVGIRKVMGAFRTNLISQFLIESILLAIISLIVGLIGAKVLLPYFNNLAGKELSFGLIAQPSFVFLLIGIAIFVGIISGSYPAFYLSAFPPARVMQSESGKSGKSGILRKLLVILQFTISTVMIIGTLVVSKQLNYFQDKDLGFEKENIMVSTCQDTTFLNDIATFKKELTQNPNVLGACLTNTELGQATGKVVFRVEDENGELAEKALNFIFSDYEFIDVMKFELIEGRNYSKDMGTDESEAFIVNEAAVKQFGWEENPIGKRIQFGINLDGTATRDGRVIGVLKDFNYGSLHNPVDPIAILVTSRRLNTLNIKISDQNINDTKEYIRNKWNEFNTVYPLEYTFLEDNLAEYYVAEQKLATIFQIFSLLTIFISCLGLYGLSSFVTEQRRKEIGVRKVLGATVPNIVFTLSISFIKLVLVSIIVAIPIAGYAMDKWLQSFVNRTDIGIMPFILAGIIALLIALVTVSYQAIRASLANPIETLKYE